MDEEQVSIFGLVLAGQTSRDIATQLNLDHIYVERVIRTTRQQLGTRTRQQAALIIANRHGWPETVSGNHLRHGATSSHFEPKTAKIAADMVNAERNQSPNVRYVREVEDRSFNMEMVFGAMDENRIVAAVKTSIETSQILQRFLLISLIMFSAALALSALISALQGFDVLLHS